MKPVCVRRWWQAAWAAGLVLCVGMTGCKRRPPAVDSAPDALSSEKTESLRGQVLDGQGQPVPGAQVFVWNAADDRLPAQQATSDAAGRFVLPALSAGVVSVLVQTAGLGAERLDQVVVPSADVLTFRVEGTGRTIVGRISHGERPVAGAYVLLGGDTLAKIRRVVSDDHGRFKFGGLGDGEYDLRAVHQSLASAMNRVRIEDGKITPPDPHLVLAQGATISGRVIDHDGQSVAEAEIAVRAVPANECPETMNTDVVGYFTTEALAFGRYQVVVQAPGYVSPPPRFVELNGPVSPLQITLQPTAIATGRVVGPDGRPVMGAEVVLEPVSTGQIAHLPRDRVPVLGGILPLAAQAAALPPGFSRRTTMRSIHGTTDRAGRFVVEGAPPGLFRIRVDHPRAITTWSDERAVNPGAHVDFGDMALLPGGLVMGTVLDETGQAVSDVVVVVSRHKGDRHRADEVITNADGFFELKVPEGSYWLWPVRPGSLPVDPIPVDVDRDGQTPPIEIRVSSGPKSNTP